MEQKRHVIYNKSVINNKLIIKYNNYV